MCGGPDARRPSGQAAYGQGGAVMHPKSTKEARAVAVRAGTVGQAERHVTGPYGREMKRSAG